MVRTSEEFFAEAEEKSKKQSLQELSFEEIDSNKHLHLDSYLIYFDKLVARGKLHSRIRNAKIILHAPKNADIYVLGEEKFDVESNQTYQIVKYYKFVE